MRDNIEFIKKLIYVIFTNLDHPWIGGGCILINTRILLVLGWRILKLFFQKIRGRRFDLKKMKLQTELFHKPRSALFSSPQARVP